LIGRGFERWLGSAEGPAAEAAAAEGEDAGGEIVEAAELGAGSGGSEVGGLGGGGEAELEPGEELVTQAGLEMGRDWGLGRALEGVVAEFPLAEAVGFPAAEVLGGDGLGAETGLECAFDRGEGIEPGEDGGGGLIVEQAAVEGLADGLRETGDFTEHKAR
jgi:hypothetical protein